MIPAPQVRGTEGAEAEGVGVLCHQLADIFKSQLHFFFLLSIEERGDF